MYLHLCEFLLLEQSKFSSVVCKFLVAHSTDHGWKVNSTNLFQVTKPKPSIDEITGTQYCKEKPVMLYSALIRLFAKPKTWVLDVFSGCGKCSEQSFNTIVIQFKSFVINYSVNYYKR